MDDKEIRDKVRSLRAQGCSPKGIARALDLRPADVRPLVRAVAEEEQQAAEPGVVGCWVSGGWSAGLKVPRRRGWRDSPGRRSELTGLVGVLVACEGRRPGEVSACGYLVDTYCLGVKDVIGPHRMDRRELDGFVEQFFQPFQNVPVEAPVDLARHLVWGAIAYARDLGFDPHPEFDAVADHLGALEEPSAIGFGRNGMPFYVEGPDDDTDRILATLERRVGTDNFHFLVSAPMVST
jgi:hypothetical protein